MSKKFIQYNSNARKPYDQQETRLSLYEALFDLCLTKNTKIAPPLSVSIGLFKNALNDHDQRVQEYAKNTLNFLRAFTYPLQPVYTKEYAIESKAEISIVSQQATDLVLPSITDENKQNLEFGKNDLQKSEIAQYMSKEQNSLNGIEINSEQTFDQATDTSNQQATKRKFNYEDDDEDDMNEPENENVYNPKSVAKKFHPNGHFQNRSLVNGRDAENSNGDDDEEEEELDEEVISLNDQGDEEDNFEGESENEMEEDEEENDEDDEDEEQEEEEEEEEEEQESQHDKDDVQAQHVGQIEKVIEEPVVQQIIIEPEQQSDPPSEKEESSKEKSSSPSNQVAEEVKNLLKQTGDDYDDEESKEIESESLCKASQETESDVQSQEISMNKFDDEQIECEKDRTINFENGNSQATDGDENDKNEVSKVEEDESKPEDNEDFDEIKFKQMCASLNN
ncbi:hypothetical protein BpHYR1_018737 [Brachionus plicatilis]|uniref:Uncharacterized protein n=1 Tax=Brachionus plicatilis TaxID=10195 RepID=A0A3M7Q9J5_BRAPC|nr:hypothetical protein BpHYR1_018737 [Brachionus plicatilis]